MSFDKQNLSGNITHNEASEGDVYYYGWTRPRPSQAAPLDSAVQDCTFLHIAKIDDDGG